MAGFSCALELVKKLLVQAGKRYQFTQRERITFALERRPRGASRPPNSPRGWRTRTRCAPGLGGSSIGLIEQTGCTIATRYFVPPALLREQGSTR